MVSRGPINPDTLSVTMFLANEKEIRVAGGGNRTIPRWRRRQLRESLEERFPESYYNAVENGNLPKFEGGPTRVERF